MALEINYTTLGKLCRHKRKLIQLLDFPEGLRNFIRQKYDGTRLKILDKASDIAGQVHKKQQEGERIADHLL